MYPPLNRQKGEKILKEFLERVEGINNDESQAHYVKTVYLFGSFLDKDKNDYSDIDLSIEVKRKIKSEKEYKKRCREIANKSGRSFASDWEEMDYAESCVYLKLKNRNQYVSLHTLYDKVLEVTEKKRFILLRNKWDYPYFCVNRKLT